MSCRRHSLWDALHRQRRRRGLLGWTLSWTIPSSVSNKCFFIRFSVINNLKLYLIFHLYRRHFSQVKDKTITIITHRTTRPTLPVVSQRIFFPLALLSSSVVGIKLPAPCIWTFCDVDILRFGHYEPKPFKSKKRSFPQLVNSCVQRPKA